MNDKRTETHVCDSISRQWLMECVNEGWIKFDTEKDENIFIHLVRDIAHPHSQSGRTSLSDVVGVDMIGLVIHDAIGVQGRFKTVMKRI